MLLTNYEALWAYRYPFSDADNPDSFSLTGKCGHVSAGHSVSNQPVVPGNPKKGLKMSWKSAREFSLHWFDMNRLVYPGTPENALCQVHIKIASNLV